MSRHPYQVALGVVLLLGGCVEYDLVGGRRVPPPGRQPTELWPNTVVDDFEQRPALASDILFVIDDSISMEEEQTNLSTNFHAFGQFLFGSDIDYHIGIVRGDLSSSSPDYPNYGMLTGSPPYIDPSTPNGQSVITTRVDTLGDLGDGVCESGMEATYLALTEPMVTGLNAGFYRGDAMLTVVIITDENDQTDFGFCDLTVGDTEDWAQWFTDLKFRPELVNLGVIAGFDPGDNRTPTYCSSVGLGDASGGAAYADAVDDIPNSITWSICNPDWTAVLIDLGIAAAGLTREFNLSRVPAWDYEDWDADGNTDEPVLEVFIDRQDGAGFVFLEPVWSDQPDQQNPWDYSRVLNAVVFTVETMPDEHWVLKALYPNSEEG
jgi:hypothetical protein